MGMDIDFLDLRGEDRLYLRNHWQLMDLIFDQPHVRVRPEYDDIYVTPPMLENVLDRIEDEMDANGMPSGAITPQQPQTQEDFLEGLPSGFCSSGPDSWVAALPHYRILVSRLLTLARNQGALICSWSA